MRGAGGLSLLLHYLSFEPYAPISTSDKWRKLPSSIITTDGLRSQAASLLTLLRLTKLMGMCLTLASSSRHATELSWVSEVGSSTACHRVALTHASL